MSLPNQSLADEVEVVNSIYDVDTLTITNVDPGSSSISAILTLPNLPFSFLLEFSSEYPEGPPEITGIQSTGVDSKKGEGEAALKVLRDVLHRTYIPGQVCLFDLIEETIPILQSQREETQTQIQLEDSNGTSQDCAESSSNRSAAPSSQFENLNIQDLTSQLLPTAAASIPPPNWILSEELKQSKSTFVARALEISSLQQATDSISHLLATNKKVASATHNITAWRIKQKQDVSSNASSSANETVIQDCDDDGETAAGGRLLHLMQLMDVWNVVVVVTRWYGGVKLGSDRFRLINNVAREALTNAGLVKEAESGNKRKGKKK